MENDKISCGAMREKYWEELIAGDKVEKLAFALEYLEREIKRLSALVYKVEQIAKEHDHLNGKVVQPVFGRGGTCSEQDMPRGRTLLNRQPK